MSMQMPIVLLREGTDQSQGKAQLLFNISACLRVVEALASTLGPRGMDKLVCQGTTTTISNDGATVLGCLEVEHPAAKVLVDIAKSQDAEVGDGTTSVVVIAGELLKNARKFIEDGVAPQAIIKSYRTACQLVVDHLEEIGVAPDSEMGSADYLVHCASTALNSKLIASHGQFFGKMAVDAVSKLDPQLLDLSLVGVKKVPGGTLADSFLVEGVAFKKTFSYAGFEQQPKHFASPKILCLHLELELRAEKDNAEIQLKDPTQYQSIVDAEWSIIYEKLDKCVASGAQIILSRLPIGDLATQYFADRNLFCAGRVADDDMKRVINATGARVQTTVNNMADNVLGTCEKFEERQVGGERYNLFTGCPATKTATIVLRGGAEAFIDETERSLHDAIMIVKRAIVHPKVIAGGGAIEMHLSKFLRERALQLRGKQQLIINGFAQALEVIPRQLATNAGLDPTDVLNQLRYKHHMGGTEGQTYGVDVTGALPLMDCFAKYVWEPTIVRRNALHAATEAANLVLSIDETVKNPKSEQAGDETPVGGRPSTGGRGMAGMMRGRGRRMRGRGGR